MTQCMQISTRDRGFTLVEIVIVVAIVLLLGAIAAPILSNTVNGIKIHYAATNLAGAFQKARIESTRKNGFFPVQQCTYSSASGDVFYYVDLGKSGTSDCAAIGTDPIINLGRFTVNKGSGGGGAPDSNVLESTLNFSNGFYSSARSVTFNARGLPCRYISGATTCVENPGRGFIYYLSGPRNSWAAVAVTPSGRVAVWSYSSGQWVQQ